MTNSKPWNEVSNETSEIIKELRDSIIEQVKEIKEADTSNGEVTKEIMVDEIPMEMRNDGYTLILQPKNTDRLGYVLRTCFTWVMYENEENFVEERLRPGLYNWLEFVVLPLKEELK